MGGCIITVPQPNNYNPYNDIPIIINLKKISGERRPCAGPFFKPYSISIYVLAQG